MKTAGIPSSGIITCYSLYLGKWPRAFAILLHPMRGTHLYLPGWDYPFETLDQSRRYWIPVCAWLLVFRSRNHGAYPSGHIDNARTPMGWRKKRWFSTGRPWLVVNPNYRDRSTSNQIPIFYQIRKENSWPFELTGAIRLTKIFALWDGESAATWL